MESLPPREAWIEMSTIMREYGRESVASPAGSVD